MGREELRDKQIQKHYAESTWAEEWNTPDVRISDMIREANLEKKAFIPERVPDVFKSTSAGESPVNRLDFPMTDMLKDTEPYLFEPNQTYTPEKQAWARQFTDAFETTYHYYQGEIPFDWLLAQDPEDLEMLRTGDYGIDNEVWNYISSAAEPYQQQQRYQQIQTEEFQKRIDTETNARLRVVGFLNTLKSVPIMGDVVLAGELGTGNKVPEVSDLDYETVRAQVTKELIEGGMEDTEPPDSESIWKTAGTWALNGVGNVFTWFGGQVDQTLQGLQPRTSLASAEFTQEGKEDEYRRQMIADAEAEFGTDVAMIEAGKSAGFTSAQDFWADEGAMEETMPGFREEWVERFGGDLRVAGLMYAGAVADSMEVEDQLELGEAIQNERIRILQEEDFQVSGATLATLAAYDKFVPSTIFTGGLLFMSDKDLRSEVLNLEFGNFYDEIKTLDRTPSAVFGMEGSAAGLALDFWGSWLVDPFNWVFAPAGAAKAARGATKAGVQASVKAGTAKLMKNDIVEAIVTKQEGMRHTLTSWIKEVDPDLADELDVVVKRGMDDTTGIIAPGVTREASDELIELATKEADDIVSKDASGAPLKPKDVRSNLEAKAQQLGDMTNTPIALETPLRGTTMGQRARVIDDNGTIWNAHWVPDDGTGGKAVVWKDGEGNVGGMLSWHPEQGAGMINNMPGVTNLMGTSLDAVAAGRGLGGDATVVEAILSAAKDSSITDLGAGSIIKQARRFIEESSNYSAVVLDAIGGQVDNVIERAILAGGDMGSVRRAAIHSAMGNKVSAAARSGHESVLRRNLQPFRITSVHMAQGPQAWTRAYENIHYMWGENIDKAGEWARRLSDERRAAVTRVEEMMADPLFHRVETVGRQLDILENDMKRMQGILQDDLADAMAKATLEDDLIESTLKLKAKYGSRSENTIEVVIKEMWDDYNREVIAKNPAWAGKVIDDINDPMHGMVPWEELKIGRLADDAQLGPGFKGLDVPTETMTLRQFRELEMKVLGAEKAGDLTPELLAKMDEGWEEFSKARGYTDEEIADFGRYLDVLKGMDADMTIPHPPGSPNWGKLAASTSDEALLASGRVVTGMEELEDVRRLDKYMAEIYGSSYNRNFSTPLSPMDMVVAGSATGATYVKHMKEGALSAVRDVAHTAHRLWVMDKIASPATAGVVSWDELYRVFHKWGLEAQTQYVRDRAMFMNARVQALLHEGKLSKYKGVEYLSDKSRKRFQELLDVPDYITEAERLTWGKGGQNIGVIHPTDAGYLEAAREWYRGYTVQPAFQHALKGEDDFRTWWYSSANSDARRMTVSSPEGPRLASWQEAYRGQQSILNALLRNVPAEKREMVLQAIKDAADDAAAGGQGYMAPEAFKYTDSVRGFQKPGFDGNKNLIGRGVEALVDKFFMEPTNYRRGLLYNMSKNKELNRLTSLYSSQGKKIWTNAEVLEELGLPAYSSVAELPPDIFTHLANKQGMVTMRHLENIAESRAMDELQDMFFAWDQGSRLGNQGRAVAPFVGPWGDMWAFWGREMMSPPILRGDLNNNKFLRTLQKGVDYLPGNPKTGSAISRLANTDLDITEGLYGEGSGPDIDLSPLFFFPTQGENSFSTLIPGLGIIPSTSIDFALEAAIDPIEDPEGYQTMLDNVAQVLPSVQYTTGNPVSDVFGGGNIAKIYKVLAGGAAQIEGNWASSRWLGDYSADIDMNRNVSATFADEIGDLLSITDPERLQLEIMAIVNDAKSTAGSQQSAQNAIRFAVPARVDFDVAAEELQQVWVDWAESAGFEVRPDLRGADLNDPELLRQYADDVRSGFFKLTPEERDLEVLKNPQLAVNLVSNWKWSSAGENTLGRESLSPYRSGGSQEDLARHQTYVERGLIEPMNPTQRAYLILGTISHARKNVAKSAYAATAQSVNDLLWEGVVDQENRAKLTLFLERYGDTYGMEPGQERRLWERWGSYEDDFEGQMAADLEIDPESEEWAEMMSNFNIPTKQRAWSTSWPGTGGASSKYAEFPIGLLPQSDETIEKFGSLNIDWDESLTGGQLYQGLLNEYQVSPGYNAEIDAPYQKWLDDSSAGPSSAESGLLTLASNDRYGTEFRDRINEFRILEAETSDKKRNRGIPLRSEIDQVRTAYRNLMVIADEEGAMTRWWEDSYERAYGPLDWEPPKPPALRDTAGNLNSNAYQPIVRKIQDGDTLIVENTQKSLFGRSEDGLKSIRLLGVRARDFGLDDEGALEDRRTLQQVLLDAKKNGDKIYLVRDPEQIGSNTDKYGRELAWLYIGDEPWFSDDAFIPGED